MNIKEQLVRVGERIGFVETSEQKLQNMRLELSRLEIEKERERLAHRLIYHSDACTSEVEYVLLISNEDPHPTHAINYEDCGHTDEEIFRTGIYYSRFQQAEEEQVRSRILSLEERLGFTRDN